jgi:hypothetical protein
MFFLPVQEEVSKAMHSDDAGEKTRIGLAVRYGSAAKGNFFGPVANSP